MIITIVNVDAKNAFDYLWTAKMEEDITSIPSLYLKMKWSSAWSNSHKLKVKINYNMIGPCNCLYCLAGTCSQRWVPAGQR